MFFIYAILGVELFGKLSKYLKNLTYGQADFLLFLSLECEEITSSCDGISRYAHFHNFGMSFLTLFRIGTGDNWNGIMKVGIII